MAKSQAEIELERSRRAEYMREYRQRRNAGAPLVRKSRKSVHEACDARIAELEAQVELLRGEHHALEVHPDGSVTDPVKDGRVDELEDLL